MASTPTRTIPPATAATPSTPATAPTTAAVRTPVAATTGSPLASASPAPRTPSSPSLRRRVVIERGAIVSDDARVSGSVTIGKGSVVHARCTITTDTAPITIGAFNIVEENVVILNRSDQPMVIGAYNVFEVGCEVFDASVGSYNAIETKAKVPEGCDIHDGCVIGMAVHLQPGTEVPDNTTVYGPNATMRPSSNTKEAHMAVHRRHLEWLHKVLAKPKAATPAGTPGTPTTTATAARQASPATPLNAQQAAAAAARRATATPATPTGK